jgi:hypothetical protein
VWLTSVHLRTRVYHVATCSSNFVSQLISPEYGLSCSPHTELAVVLLPLACLALPNFRLFSGIKRRKLPVYVPVASSFAVSQAVYFNFDAAGTFFVLTFSLK